MYNKYKNKIIITTLLLLTGALVYKTVENAIQYKALHELQTSIPSIEDESMVQACVITVNYMCNRQVDCVNIPVEELQGFCNSARRK